MASKKTTVNTDNITKYRKNTTANTGKKGNTASNKSKNQKNNSKTVKEVQVNKRSTYVPEEDDKKGMSPVTAGVIGVLSALVLELCNLNIFGKFGEWIKYGQFGLFGAMAYIFPLLVLILFIASTFEEKKKRTIISIICAFIFICSFTHLVSAASSKAENILSFFTTCAETLSGGGIVGGTIAFCLRSLLSGTGAIIITVILILLCLFVLFEEPIKNILDGFSYMDNEDDIYDDEDDYYEDLPVKRNKGKKAVSEPDESEITAIPDKVRQNVRKSAPKTKQRTARPSRYYDETLYEDYDDDGRIFRIVTAKKRRGRIHSTPMTRTVNKAQPLRSGSIETVRAGNKVRGLSSQLDMMPHNANGDEIHEITRRRSTRSQQNTVSANTGNRFVSRSDNENNSLRKRNLNQPDYEQLSFDEEELMRKSAADETEGFELQGVFNRPEALVTSVSQAAVNRRAKESRPVKVRRTVPSQDENRNNDNSGTRGVSNLHGNPSQQEPAPAAYGPMVNSTEYSSAHVKTSESAAASAASHSQDRTSSVPGISHTQSSTSSVSGISHTQSSTSSVPAASHSQRPAPAASSVKAVPAEIKLKNSSSDTFYTPPVDLLAVAKSKNATSEAELEKIARDLEIILNQFGVHVTVTDIQAGPSVTRFELQPELGTRVNKITSLADDLKLNLGVTEIRIEAPIPGRQAVGIEIPNKNRQTVYMRELMEDPALINHPSKIAFAAGKDISGNVIVADIAKMPHLLVAGTTGSGKSVFLNSILMTILYRATPAEVGLIIIDPKKVEFGVYAGIPHLMREVVTDPGQAVSTLRWAVNEMTNRYQRMQMSSVRDFKSYNAKVEKGTVNPDEENPRKMNQIVIIIDELADLMMVAKKEAEALICRLAQLARAAGIHLIIATQRPSVDVVTGLIKANVPARVALLVSSQIDSRTIIDMQGAEKLLGNGDMLFYPTGYVKPVRVQGAYVSDDEIQETVDYLIDNNSTDYFAAESKEIEKFMNSSSSDSSDNQGGSQDNEGNSNKYDEYFFEAGKLCIEMGKASSSMLQRRFNLGFNRAARIIDQLQEFGVVGPQNGAKPRQILVDTNTFEEMYENINN